MATKRSPRLDPYRIAIMLALLASIVGAWFLLNPIDQPGEVGESLTPPAPTAETASENAPPTRADSLAWQDDRNAEPESHIDDRVVQPPPPMIEDPEVFVEEWSPRVSPLTPAEWLPQPRLLERLVAATSAVADGEDPVRHLRFARPSEGTYVPRTARDGRLLLETQTPDRYRPFVDALLAVDDAETVRAFQLAEPFLERAYRDLGHPDRPFRTVVLEAIDVLISTPEPKGPVELVPRGIVYAYAAPNLQALEPAQRFLLRLSPSDRMSTRAKLVAIKRRIESL